MLISYHAFPDGMRRWVVLNFYDQCKTKYVTTMSIIIFQEVKVKSVYQRANIQINTGGGGRSEI